MEMEMEMEEEMGRVLFQVLTISINAHDIVDMYEYLACFLSF